MIRHAGGSKVEGGYYLNTRSFEMVMKPSEGTLPGSTDERYLRVPWPLLLVAAPVIGGVFVLAYPVIGLSLMVYGLVRKAAGAAGETAKDLAASVAPGHAVGEAHLSGKPGEGAPAEGSHLEGLEAEIRKAREARKEKED
jgi:hypothetical protein